MKTPREILLKRHQAVAPKLDAIRHEVVGEGRRVAAPESMVAGTATLPFLIWREWLYSLRWHLAGLGAAWLVIGLLNLSVGHPASLAAAIPRGKIPSPRIILASLRENRRELLELIQPVEWREAQPQKSIPPQPRSQRCHEILVS